MQTPTTTAPDVMVERDTTGYTQQIETGAPLLLADARPVAEERVVLQRSRAP